MVLDQYIQFIEDLVSVNGPDEEDYFFFDLWLSKLYEEYKDGRVDQESLEKIRKVFGKALSNKTMQGVSLQKQFGYPGDFEVIDKIYTNYITDEDSLKKWDLYFHSRNAANAVRNRKLYFIQLLQKLENELKNNGSSFIRMLDLAGGPGRDLLEYYSTNPRSRIYTDCLDMDVNALNYAKKLCKDIKNVSFINTNAFRFVPDYKYELIWVAGLFDYLTDKQFVFLLKHYLEFLQDSGEIVIGNFSHNNAARPSMELILDWNINHRTKEKLELLAYKSGATRKDVYIKEEDEGVNLFLHIKK